VVVVVVLTGTINDADQLPPLSVVTEVSSLNLAEIVAELTALISVVDPPMDIKLASDAALMVLLDEKPLPMMVNV